MKLQRLADIVTVVKAAGAVVAWILIPVIVVVVVVVFAYSKPIIPPQMLPGIGPLVTSSGAIIAVIIALYVYYKNKKWNAYRYLADLYYEILRRGLEHPEFRNPEYTRKYKELRASNPKMYFKYDAYARMCWTHAFDIHDTKELKKDFISLYLPTIDGYNRLHGVWLLDHTSTFSFNFIDFVLSYKWREREYLGKYAARWVRWENVVDDFDGEILNPCLKTFEKRLFDCIKDDDDIKEYLKKKEVYVADFGCGNEKFIELLHNKFGIDNVHGIDFPDNMLEMAKKGCNLKNNQYLFSWDNIPGNEDEKLIKFLVEDIGIDWAENAKIGKSNDGTTISIYKDEKNSAKIIMVVNKEKAILKISDGRTRDLKVKTDNNKLNIYKIDIAFSINSILPRNPNAIPIILDEIYKSLTPGGLFIAILPSFDTVLYLKELWYKCRIDDLETLCKFRLKNFGKKMESKIGEHSFQ
jgi:SAM-dependent methyltransferase